MADAWNPHQYGKFSEERAQPFWDLAAGVGPGANWLDIGCGTGELTRALHARRLPASTLGIDSSANMLRSAISVPGLTFAQARVEDFAPSRSFDVIFSNAALQWCDDHPTLFPRIVRWLAPGGQLAVQMPMNADHESHRLAEVVAAEFGLAVRRFPVLAPEAYAALLWNLGLREIDVTMKVYLHPLPGPDQVVEWVKGSLLTYYAKQLTPARFAEFLVEYKSRFLAEAAAGPYLYTFKRVLIHARRV